jgi:PKD repeat protein
MLGCSGGGGGGGADSSAALAANCKAEDIDPSTLAIDSNSAVKPGDVALYKLNQNVGCSQHQKVSWRKVGTSASKEAETLTTSYDKSGQYVVTAKVLNLDTNEVITVSTKTTVAGSNLVLSAPDYGMMFSPVTFTLVPPTGMTLTSAQWNFGDGSALQSGIASVDHTFEQTGTYTVNVAALTSAGATITLSQSISIMEMFDGYECMTEMGISGASSVNTGETVTLSAFIPECIGSRTSSVIWNLGDGSTVSGAQSVNHSFAVPGTYTVSVAISVIGAPIPNPMFTLTHTVVVSDPKPTDPPNPLACTTAGETRDSYGESYGQDAACGVNGHKTDMYRGHLVETCQMSQDGKTLLWTVTSRTQDLISSGECQGQSCLLPGGTYLADGAQVKLYSSQLPEAACSTVEQVRSCTNGALSGSASYKYAACTNGCAGFGPSGTVKTGIVIGEISVAKSCQFNESGIFDLFQQLEDQTCSEGTVNHSNVRQGAITTAGICPTYSWAATDDYTTCSANCGGEQTRIYVCRDNSGAQAAASRCAESAPVQKRICDGNPDAATRSESETTTQEGGSSNSCPVHQIGVIIKSRDMTVTTNYACVDHQVKQVSQTTTYGVWETDNYCRDYVGFRCSQDSLDNTHASGRYKWMLKCKDKVPVIKEFLDKFDDVHVDSNGKENEKYGFGIGANGRVLYPTFMNRQGRNKQHQTCEQPWVAPTNPDASCNVPSTVYVAAVCLSSCATPEQNIMVEDDATKSLVYMTFGEAWQKKIAFVATLQSESQMSSKDVIHTKVDQWVTELIDTDHEVLEFRMKSGGQLRVTPNHPLLGSDAILRLSSDFKVGDKLVKLGGETDEIVSITSSNYFGKVYNVFVKSAAVHKNIVVTNGYLNGTAMFQNEGAEFVNIQLFKGKLINGVFEE